MSVNPSSLPLVDTRRDIFECADGRLTVPSVTVRRPSLKLLATGACRPLTYVLTLITSRNWASHRQRFVLSGYLLRGPSDTQAGPFGDRVFTRVLHRNCALDARKYGRETARK